MIYNNKENRYDDPLRILLQSLTSENYCFDVSLMVSRSYVYLFDTMTVFSVAVGVLNRIHC